MANRLKWQQISAQGLNPQSAMGVSIGGFQGAAQTIQALRNSERANDTLIQNSYSDLIKSYLGSEQLELQQQTEARKAKKEASFNPAIVEKVFTDHFAAGGTPENFLDNPEVMGLINEYGDSVFKHGIQTFNRFNTGIEKEASRLTELAETTKAARLLEIDGMGLDEAVAARMKNEIENEHVNILAGIQEAAFNNFTNLRQSRNRFLGLEPEEVTTEGGTSSPVERQTAKSNEFNEYMSQLHTEHGIEAKQLEQDYSNGLINEAEYNRQRTELNESYNQKLRELGKDTRRYNITSITGDGLSFDYTELPNGGIQAGNRELPREVSNSLRVAVDSFGVPMEVMLAFAVQESSLNSSAVSPTGVKGLMQVTKDTGREMLEKNKDLFEFYGITDDNIDDRNNPLVSAMTGAAYIAHIRDNILHGDAPIEQVYVAYNVGPNNALVKQFHNRNVPIDKLPGVNVKSAPIQNNIDMYYDKSRDAWRTPAEISALVRKRMNLVPTGEDPVTAISRVAKAGSQETSNAPVVDTELEKAEASSRYHQIDLNRDPIGELDRVTATADSVRPPKTLGVDGKLGFQLSATEFGDILTVMGVTPDSKRIAELHRIVRDHPTLSTMPAEEVSVLLSFSPENMWGGIDKATTLANIDASLEMWDQQRDKIRAQMTSASNLKKYATAYSEIRDKLQGRISKLEDSLSKFDNRQLTRIEERAREETARLLASTQTELASATTMYQGRMQEDYEKILRFRHELKQTWINKPSADAQSVIDELMKKNHGNSGITRKDLEAWEKEINSGKPNSPLISYIEEITSR